MRGLKIEIEIEIERFFVLLVFDLFWFGLRLFCWGYDRIE